VVCFIQLSEAGLLYVSLEIYKIEHGAVIKFFVKEGLTPNEIHSKFIEVYGDSSPSFSTIKKWAAEFKCGRINGFIRRHVPYARALHSHRCANLRSRKLS
jgi:hypothetical protein